ncbi:conjugal transfer protein TraI [Chitinophaga cymbidii]|uniref:Conjugal transfer protein TraI n=1 Tax=Chitinophaga cymbidii TaxID=1096750 RepID=A0A512RFL9_9BACT|nr:conjugal transfer protein TraI [Chitinophaga cymbidii]GEP94500.1 hypothetical protein CCY01nite_07600 [Chitinophaga cymbidii]
MRAPLYKAILVAGVLLFTARTAHSQVVVLEAIKILTKKVIRAIDLGIQKAQSKTIDLQNAQRQIENALSKLKLQEISDWTERQKEIYQEYFDELWRVKSIISYKQFTDIVDTQKQLFEEYKHAWLVVSKDKNFSEAEMTYIYNVYTNILEASIGSVDDIVSVMKSFSVQMSDGERLEMIRKTSEALDTHLASLRQFNQRNRLLSLQRARSKAELDTLQQWYQKAGI